MLWKDVQRDPHKESWYNLVMERYTKNHHVGLWSIPVTRSSLPSSTTILQAVSPFKVKTTNTPNLYDFCFRLCANGSKQVQGRYFDKLHSHVGSYRSLRMMIALEAACIMILYGIDVDNAFQCTPKLDNADNPPVYLSMPPLYIAWFRKYFPTVQL